MVLYHGTTLNDAKSIQATGFSDDVTRLWAVSEPNCAYFWCPNRLLELGEVETIEEAHERAKQMAFESAQIAAAVNGSSENKIAVIEYQPVDNEEPNPDTSCKNMEHSGAVYIYGPVGKVEKIWVTGYSPWFAPLILKGLLGMQYLETSDIDPALLKTAELLKDTNIFIDELLEFDPVLFADYTEV